ncbi:MAG: hypothetical protein AAF513_17095 [Pseudomonadota bacterium]
MDMPRALTLLFTATLLTVGSTAAPAPDDAQRILYMIYDSSNSMWGPLADGERKYEAARIALGEFAENQDPQRPMALRIYGAQSKDDCRDSQLMLEAAPGQQAKIRAAVEAVRPTGQTPIDYSLRAALRDLGDRPADIVVVTDGIESCDADPCALLEAWQQTQTQINVHVVGLGLSAKEMRSMQCFAEATGNPVLDAQSTSELTAALDSAAVVQQPDVDFGFVADDAAGPSADIQILAQGRLIPVQDEGDEQLAELPVESHHRYTPPPGRYVLEAGVTTLSGEAYEPVQVEVDLRSDQRITISPPLPPLIRATFHDGVEPLPRAHRVKLWQDGEERGGFNSRHGAWVMPGTYEARVQTDRLNVLSKMITIAPGERPTIAFETRRTARIYVNFVSAQTGKRIRNNPSLWQNGEEQGRVRGGNGGIFLPGDYIARIHDGLQPYESPISISGQSTQNFEFTVPTGQVKVIYQDAAGNPEADKRVFVYSKDESVTRQSSRTLTLLPGEYRLQGHPRGQYAEQRVVVTADSEQEAILRRQ